MILLHDARYGMQLNGGGDVWRIQGKVYNHPQLGNGEMYYPSTPIAFDEQNLIVTSASGKQYQIVTFEGNPETTINQIKKDIEKGGYEVH